MKKLCCLIVALFAIHTGFAQSVLPNGDFENWSLVGTPPSQVWQLDGGYWGTLNELGLLPPPAGPVTVFRTDTFYSGQYAARLVSKLMIYLPNNIFIPGLLGTAQLAIAQATIHLGKPCPACHPLNLKGYYMYTPVNGDSCTALLIVSKWNSALNKRDTLGYCRQDFKENVTTYTAFDLPVKYGLSAEAADSMTILLVSSGGFNVTNLMDGVGQVGSIMWVDAVTVDYPAGIQQIVGKDVDVHSYPNPASDLLTFELGQKLDAGRIEIYDVNARLLETHSLTGTKNIFPVDGLPVGSYFYKILNGKILLNTGNFIIQR